MKRNIRRVSRGLIRVKFSDIILKELNLPKEDFGIVVFDHEDPIMKRAGGALPEGKVNYRKFLNIRNR